MSNISSLAFEAFPSYDNGTRIELYYILIAIENITHPSLVTNIAISFFGILTTTLHLFILSRRTMMKSSVISIMIGIAILDFLAMMVSILYNTLYLVIQDKNEHLDDPCTVPLTRLPFYTYWISVVIYDLFRRSSLFLSVLLALIRWLIIKFGTRRTFRKVSLVSFGFHVVFGSCLASFPLSAVYYFRYDIKQIGVCTPGKNCTDSPSTVIYNLVQSNVYTANDGIVGKIFQLVNGIVSKIIPCLLLPILSFILILELQKARKQQQRSTPATERTTGLVVFMTVSSFCIELPGGIVRVLQVFYADAGYWRMATSVNHVVNVLYSINSALHGFIFYLMSSQYQKTFRMVFRREEPRIIVAHSSLQLT